MSQGNFRTDGGTFTSADIDFSLALYAAGFLKTFILNALRFALLHPFSALKVIWHIPQVKNSMTLKNKVISIMQVKNLS